MAHDINLTSQKWLDIIFEGRNQSYGAYVLRRQSSKRHLIAFVIGLVFVFIVVMTTLVVKRIQDSNAKISYNTGVEVGDWILEAPETPEELTKPDFQAPPPLELAKTISYQVPTIKQDELVREDQEIKSVDEVIDAKDALVSIVDNAQGRTDGLGVDPGTLIIHQEIVDKPVEDNKIWEGIVEQPPSFPGGQSAMYEWLSKNIVYPVPAQELNIQGRVVLQFVVGKNGEITDIIIARSVDGYLDKEAVRVVKAMPKWIPGRQGGNAVKVRYTLPVQFRLQ